MNRVVPNLGQIVSLMKVIMWSIGSNYLKLLQRNIIKGLGFTHFMLIIKQ